MAKYIELEVALALIRPDKPEDEKATITIATAKKFVRSGLYCIPAADVVPVVHGRWIPDGDFVICSQCEAEMNQKNSLGVDNFKNYCPNCGAKMDWRAENG